jgi:hypothetical protein
MATTLTKETTQKITISLPQDLLERFKARIPARQRSVFIAKILEEYLALEEQMNALAETAGCWRDEHHPDMATGADIDNWLKDLRGSWQRSEGD